MQRVIKMLYKFSLEKGIKLMPRNTAEEIIQNVSMIVSTIKGTVPLDREFGISVELIDAPMNRQSRLIAEVAAAIEKFEPRARLHRIEFGGEVTAGKLNPTLTLEIVES